MPAKKKATAKAEPVQVEGFETQDYEGMDSFTCLRSKCGFQTFDAETADAHRTEHEDADDDAEILETLTANLPETLQFTTEEVTDE